MTQQYTVIARRFRPQTFNEVLGQELTVTVLKNAIKQNRLGQAYLFCGTRGTGKTTLARVFAKALNCLQPTSDGEPCNACTFCREIAAGTSLDVLEIDGASHRGIDDIRQINETVGYAAASGKYKIYIIDEVHMLTKEAFNALLKTLEEPPAKVKFFFATTEPHKVPQTILSRCQRFNLNRIPPETIVIKLQQIVTTLERAIDDEALRLIASHAEGALRDAESLLDQILTFHDGRITADQVAEALGIVPRTVLFALDRAGAENNLAAAFSVAQDIFFHGKDIPHFVESLTEHFRNLALIKISGTESLAATLSAADLEQYQASAKLYTKEQCLHVLDFLIEAQNQIRFATSIQIALEVLLLRILRSHQRIPVEYLVRRLAELEQRQQQQPPTAPPPRQHAPSPEKPATDKLIPTAAAAPPIAAAPPTPGTTPSTPRYDTLLQFAAVELEGRIERKQFS